MPPPPHQQADLPPSWLPMTIFTLQGRLFYGIGLLLTGALAAWAGQVENGMFQWAIALIILLQPLHDECVEGALAGGSLLLSLCTYACVPPWQPVCCACPPLGLQLTHTQGQRAEVSISSAGGSAVEF